MKEIGKTEIIGWESGAVPEKRSDEVANEEPLEIRIEGRPVSVTMRTPGRDAELALGFLLSEGLIRRREDVVAVEPYLRSEDCNIVDVKLAGGVAVDFAQLTRHVFASSSCGLCGKATIDAVHRNFPPVESDVRVAAPVLLGLPESLRRLQATFERTGGLHAAAIFEPDGSLVVVREDVGRHNAVDKILGLALEKGLMPLSRQILLVSGRSSFEIMQKALAGGIPIVAAVSAPSSLAVQFARESRQTLVGFVRGQRLNVYAGAERIVWPASPAPRRLVSRES